MTLREQVDRLPRYLLVLQPDEGWSKEQGREHDPVLHSVVKLDDVLALLDEQHAPTLAPTPPT